MENETVTEVKEHQKKDDRTIEITVNYKTVRMTEREVTGLEIKTAAIDQGVNIRPDFVLFEEKGAAKRKVIGDAEVVKIHHGSKFEAIPHDDNS